MAHVKIIRRSMRPEEWLQLRFGWLKRGIYQEKYEITDLTIRDARQIGENEYEFYPDGERPLRRGDLYFTPDGTAFIRGTVRVPAHLRGQKLYLSLRTAAEMIVKVNGFYIGGIDPNRERLPLFPYIDRAETLFIEIEGYNRSKPDDERNDASMALRGCRQVFEGAYLATIRDNVQSLVYDCTLLLDIASSEYFHEDYRKFLYRELNRALDFIDFDTWEGIDAAASHIEAHIYANHDYHGSGDVALVGHSHLDIAYYWRRIHAVQKNARTILIQMRLMDQYPEFRYTHTQAYTYEMLEKYYPELFAELKEKIKRGQFEPVGAMYVEPDCNVPSAESLIRQLLYGQLYFRQAFGMTLDNAWLPDVFGNSWILPQILKKSGVDYFVSNKMSTWNDTNRFPHNHFIWKGIDGSRVYACVPPTHFITWNMPSQIQENWEAYQDKQVGGQTLSMYGYGDGGSGCTEEMLEMVRRFDKLSIMPHTELTGGSDFLRKNLKDNKNLAVWDGELYLEMHRGTFTTKSNLKKLNRLLESKLREAEIVSALRLLAEGTPYPADTLRECYKKLLLNQFHDILPGSHIHPVYEDAMADYAEIDRRLSALFPEKTGIYFNSLNFRRTFPTFIPSATGPDERHGERGYWSAPHIDGLSSGIPAPLPGQSDWLTLAHEGETLIAETPSYVIHFAPDGSMTSIWDKLLSREWVKPGHGFNKMHLYADNPGNYDAWDILPNYKDVEPGFALSSPLTLLRADRVCAVFSVDFATKQSRWTMLIRLFAASRVIEIEHIADWHEKHRLAKINYAPNVLTREILCDTSAGFIARDLTKNTTWQQARFEVCSHKWCDLSESDSGMAFLSESKYGVGLEEDEISLSLLRATIRPDVASDMGHHDFCYAIFPHQDGPVAAQVNRVALEYNIPLAQGNIQVPAALREALCSTPLFLQAMKLAEAGNELILRLSEQNGTRGRLCFPFPVRVLNLLEDCQSIASSVPYSPFELITVGIPTNL